MARLITVPISHYCEKARWALDRAGVDYTEERHLQLLQRRPSRRAGGSGTVPVLVLDDRALAESTEIVRWADAELLPDDEVEREVAELDAFGVEARLWVYHRMLPLKRLALKYNVAGVPTWQRLSLPLVLPMLGLLLRRHLGIRPETVAAAEERIAATLDRVAERLAGAGPYLFGDRFTAADLTFAAMAAPLVLPDEYAVPLPRIEELPADLAAECRAFREHPAGAFALRLFREERRTAAP